MEQNDNLFELGKVALQKQSDYLKLKIEKEVASKEPFIRDEELLRAHTEWQEASHNYRTLFESLNSDSKTEPLL